ncbi:MAG: DUF429 domain-containing protein [Thiotrichales bacterium]|nr:DUF429 domain-containing protein [Thiotrichales bacterium]
MSKPPIFIGIDLSGPANCQDTSLCSFDGDDLKIYRACDDAWLQNHLNELHSMNRPIFLAIDAPLSYQPGGGYRDVDRALRQLLNEKGYSKIGVMSPTFNRMVYLTLRAFRLKEICTYYPNIKLFETHPGAALAIFGADYKELLTIKSCFEKGTQLIKPLLDELAFSTEFQVESDHDVMAISAMLSAYRYANQSSLWQFGSKLDKQPLFIL